MRISGKWLMAGGVAVALASVVPAMATASGRTAGGGQAAGRLAAARRPVLSTGLASLSPPQLAGQRVIYSYPGLTPPASLISLIQHGEAAGVIFFGQNISSKTQIAAVIKQLDQADASPLNPVQAPLLLMTDQEGGQVRRLPGRPYLSEKQIGANPQAETLATEAGQGAASNLRSVGMNVNLAPVLDVYRKAGDFDDQFGRSYSTSTRQVSRLGASFIAAQQATGVAATAKHFPGLGAADASQNTDEQPVTLDVPRSTLRGTDEYPYEAAIQAGVKLVMVSWAVYPALDPGAPAGLSAKVVGGELRQRLGFTGVTITDALEAGALQAYGTTRHRATMAAGAGMDLILCSAQQAAQGNQARVALSEDYQHGKLNQAAFRAAVQRVLALRSSLRG